MDPLYVSLIIFSSCFLQYTNDFPLKYMFTMLQLLNSLKSPVSLCLGCRLIRWCGVVAGAPRSAGGDPPSDAVQEGPALHLHAEPMQSSSALHRRAALQLCQDLSLVREGGRRGV